MEKIGKHTLPIHIKKDNKRIEHKVIFCHNGMGQKIFIMSYFVTNITWPFNSSYYFIGHIQSVKRLK